MRHANLSIFVPHAGCPHCCSFCSQPAISGAQKAPDGKQVEMLCRCAVKKFPKNVKAEIAFFGGSFTALNRDYLLELLKAAFPFVENGMFSGIRISTRPDYIDWNVLQILKDYGVTAVELGAQSMDDEVLEKNQRGHCAADVENAAEMVKKAGFSLGLQMMTGLFASNRQKDCFTAAKLAALQPDGVRVYPTVVLEGTALAKLYRNGHYLPQNLEQAVDLGAELLDFYALKDIPVIRMGLHDEPSLHHAYLAGPLHPAFRELCEGLLLAKRVAARLKGVTGTYVMRVAPEAVSKMLGHRAFPVEYLRRLGYNISVKADKALLGLEFQIIEDVDDAPAQLGDTGIQIVSR